MDDSALVYKGQNGLVIITGCSHAGICNIVSQAKKLFNENKIADIIGGFHLLNPEKNLMSTLGYLEKQEIDKIHPCHSH